MTIHQQPEILSFVDNKVPLDVSGENMYQVIGSPAMLNLVFTYYNTASPGNSITITHGGNELKIDIINGSPDVYEYIYSGSINAEWIAGLCDKFNSLYSLQKNYIITHEFMSGNNHKISFVARENGTALAITATSTLSASTLFISAPGATDTVLRPGYSILAQVRAGTTVLGTELQSPDKFNRATFDLSEYLQSAVEALQHDQLPFFKAQVENVGVTKYAAAKSFSLYFGEVWDGGETILNSITGLSAFSGGLSRRKVAELADDNETVLSVVQEKGWHTWQPATKITSRNTPERLYFLRYSEAVPGDLRLRGNIWYQDGTQTLNVLLTQTTATPGQLCEFIIDPVRLPYSNVAKFDVWLTNEGGIVISDEQHYIIDSRHYHNEEIFVFRNSLGGYDTLRCTGRITAEHTVSGEIFTDQQEADKVLENLMAYNYEVNSGSIPLDYINWLNDLFVSREVYWLKQGRLVPVVLTSKKKTAFDDMQRRFNIRFSYRVAQQENHYSQLTQKATGGGGAG